MLGSDRLAQPALNVDGLRLLHDVWSKQVVLLHESREVSENISFLCTPMCSSFADLCVVGLLLLFRQRIIRLLPAFHEVHQPVDARVVAVTKQRPHLLIRLCVVDAQHARPHAEHLIDDVVSVAHEQLRGGDSFEHTVEDQQTEEAHHPLIFAFTSCVVECHVQTSRPLHTGARVRCSTAVKCGRVPNVWNLFLPLFLCFGLRGSLGSGCCDSSSRLMQLHELEPLKVEDALECDDAECSIFANLWSVHETENRVWTAEAERADPVHLHARLRLQIL